MARPQEALAMQCNIAYEMCERGQTYSGIKEEGLACFKVKVGRR